MNLGVFSSGTHFSPSYAKLEKISLEFKFFRIAIAPNKIWKQTEIGLLIKLKKWKFIHVKLLYVCNLSMKAYQKNRM